LSSCACQCESFPFDICIQQWATYQQSFTWLSPQTVSTGGQQVLPVDLTGFTPTLQIAAYPLSSIILYDASSNITLNSPSTGGITIIIPAATTGGFTWWSGVYDLLLTSLDGTVYRFAQGSVTVQPGVST